MALIKCLECQKEVSSEAQNCPHCGFPIKSPPKDADIPIVREANPAKSRLGIFFIVLGIIGVIIGFIVIQPSEVEKIQEGLVKSARNNLSETIILVNKIGDSLQTEQAMAQANQWVRNAESDLDKTVSERYTGAACFFIPAGILFVLGLVLRASAKPNKSKI